MALTLGTNSGFVLTIPSADPAGTGNTIDGQSVVTKHTTPTHAKRITEIGWYRSAGTDSANFEIALYAADGTSIPGEAGTRLYWDATNSDTEGGWVRVLVDWAVNGNTAYWLGLQMDAHSGSSEVDYADTNGVGSDARISQTTLNDPYGGGTIKDADSMYAIYALVSPDFDATKQTYTLTGKDLTALKVDRKFDATKQTYALTGNSITLSRKKNFSDTLALSSLTSTPKLSRTTDFLDTLALSSLTSTAKLTKVITFSDTLALTSLTSTPNLSLGTIVDFSDTLALTSLTSTPKLTKQVAFSDTLALDSLTSNPDLFKLVDFKTERLVDSLTVNKGTLTSGDKTNTYTANDSRLIITEGTGLGNAFDVEFVFKAISDVPYGVFIEGYYEGNPGHNVKLKIKNNSSAWDNVTANTQDLPHATSDQNYFFNLPSLTNYISSGQITLKLEHTSAGTPGHTLNIDKMIVMPIVNSLTSSPDLTKVVAFTDTLSLTSLTSSPKLTLQKSFADILNLTSLTSNVKLSRDVNFIDTLSLTSATSIPDLFRAIDFSDTLALNSLTSSAKLFREVSFSDTLALSSLTSDATLFTGAIVNFSDSLALTSLTSDTKLFRDVTFSDTLALTSLTSTADLFRSVDFSDTLALTSLTSNANLTLGAIVNFADTLALTSLTSTPKLFRLAEFGDTLVLTSLTSNPEMKLAGINNFSDTLNLTSLTSSPNLTILAEIKSVQILYDGTIVIAGIVKI